MLHAQFTGVMRMIYNFGEYELDTRLFELRRAGISCPLEPQVFDVLAYLIRHRDRVVTKDELFEQIWPGRIVTDSTLNNRIMAARKAIGDSGRAQRLIATVHGRGFRFIAAVEEEPDGAAEANATLPLPRTVLETHSSSIPIARLSQEGAELLHPRRTATTFDTVGPEPAPVLGREAELNYLDQCLEQVLRDSKRRVVFVTGETGAGKTTLVEAFLHRAREHTGLWIGRGQCVNHRGVVEAYMPVLKMLGRICRGPGGKEVIDLLAQHAPTWLVQMPGLLTKPELQVLQQSIVGTSRERMMREMAETVDVLTADRPLILVLEDLHWSDYSTLDLIALLAARQDPARLLLIGTYRPADAMREGHPLHALNHQLDIHGQSQELSLGLLDQTAIEAYLQQRFLGSNFAGELVSLIHERTDGNPLFMVRLVEYWIGEGLISMDNGQWTVQNTVREVGRGIPESLKQLVSHQLELLSPADQTVLEAASVAGMEFSSAAVAAALELPEEDAEEQCASLARQGQFLRSGGIANWSDGTVAARFQFIHHLCQEVLYERVPAGRRRRFHDRIGKRLETGYAVDGAQHAFELAMHFIRGYDIPRAVKYLQSAAEQAVQRRAHKEAIEHLRTALGLLMSLPDSPERAESELKIQLALGSTLVKMHGWASPEAEQAFIRARTLSEQIEGHPHLIPILYELAVLYEYRGEYDASQELMNQRLRLSQGDFLPEAHELLACSTFYQGRFSRSLEHAQQGLVEYEAEPHPTAPGFWGHNSGILCRDWAALALWFLGYPDQARTEAEEALHLAHAPENAQSLSNVQMKTAILYQCLQEADRTLACADATVALATNQGFVYRVGAGMILQGWAWTLQGRQEEGLSQMRQGLDIHQATGANMDRPYFLGLLADACLRSGRVSEAFSALSDALTMVQRSRSFFFEPELHRLQGVLLLQLSGDHTEAETCFQKAFEIAERQQSKSLMLRAALSLAGLWQKLELGENAHTLVESVYNTFTEGFETHDVMAAEALLAALAHDAGHL